MPAVLRSTVVAAGSVSKLKRPAGNGCGTAVSVGSKQVSVPVPILVSDPAPQVSLNAPL